MNRPGQAARARIVAEQILEQRTDRVGPERCQRQLAVVRLLHPGGVVLGTEVEEQEAGRAGDRVDPLLEEDLAAGIHPMKILDERRESLTLKLGDVWVAWVELVQLLRA